MNYRRAAGAVFREYGDVSFASADQFAQLAERFLSDSQKRSRIAESMRRAVVSHYSYGALVDDLLAFISKRVSTDALST